MGEPKLDLSSSPAHWGMNFTKSTHTQPAEHINPANVSLPPGYTVVVTGAGKGIGKAIARSFVQASASNVIITSRTRHDLEQAQEELESLAKQNGRSVNVSIVVQDAAKAEGYAILHDLIEKDFDGRLDCLVCNAGGGPVKSLLTPHIHDTDTSEWDQSFAINFTGAYYAAKHLMPLLLGPQSCGKTIINIGSAAAHFAGGNVAPACYSMSKLALIRFTEILAQDHAEKGVIAATLHPGSVATPGALELMPSSLHEILTDSPSLCGNVCVWIASEKRQWISGRYISSTWDMAELESRKDEILQEDKLKFRMVV